MNVALLGFGTVGSSVARILCDPKPEGIQLSYIFNRGVARKKVDWVPASVAWTEDFDTILRSDVDVVIELVGGLEPAGTWVRKALEAGKSVVTGNKKLIAKAASNSTVSRAPKADIFSMAQRLPVAFPLFLGCSKAWQATALRASKPSSTAPATTFLAAWKKAPTFQRFCATRSSWATPNRIPAKTLTATTRVPSW